MQRDLERGIALVNEAVALLDGAASRGPVDGDALANALLLRANAEFGLVRPTRTADIERGLGLITPDGRSWEKEGAEGVVFGLARLTDDLDRAIAITREMIRSKSGPGGDDPFNVVMLSGLLLFRGDWAEAREQAEAAMAGYQGEGDVHPAWALRGLALVAAHDGRTRRRPPLGGAGLDQATQRGDVVIATFHHHILAFLALVDENWPDASAHLAAAADGMARSGVRHPGRFKFAGDQVETALALGDVERARAVVEQLDEAARVAPTPWVVAVGARCSALLAAAEGDFEAAASTFDRALVEHDRLPMPFERGRTLLAKGRLHRRRNETPPRRRDAPRGARLLRNARCARLGRENPGGAGSGRPPAARPGHADRDRAARRRARGHRSDEPRDRRTGVPRAEDRRQRPGPGVREARHPLPRGARRADRVRGAHRREVARSID